MSRPLRSGLPGADRPNAGQRRQETGRGRAAAAGLLLALAAALPVRADPALARARNCLTCHALEGKVMGPGFREVARRYAGQADAADKLAVKIVKGGAGSWGVVQMPANPQVSEAEARRLALWILGR